MKDTPLDYLKIALVILFLSGSVAWGIYSAYLDVKAKQSIINLNHKP